jgi:hypothetical protein
MWHYWWQKSDVWSQASYRYPILWEAFLNPSDSYFLFADFVDFYTHWVYKNQLSRQTGSRNLIGPKTFPTIWYTYMMLVTKYQISVINSCWEKCDEKATIDDRNLIFGHKLHIGTPYCGKRFWTHRIPTSCLPTLLIFIHIKLVTKYQISAINSCWEKCDEKWPICSMCIKINKVIIR